MKEYGFVYIWKDKKRNMFYIGCHWGNETDGYICSSNRMRKAYRRRPNDFKRRIIIRIYTNKLDLLKEEYRLLQYISDYELGTKYYNLSKRHFGHWSTDINKKKFIGQKISCKQLGRPLTKETKEKLSKAKKGKKIAAWSEERKKQASISRKGKPSPKKGKPGHIPTKETREKMSKAAKNKSDKWKSIMKNYSHSKEIREKISIGLKEAYKNGIR